MTRQLTSRTPADRKRALLLAGALIGVSVALGACQHTGDVVTTASVPDDYRLRHPIAVQEADRSIVVFVGRGRGGISVPPRAINVRQYHPEDPRHMAAIRLNYPKISAVAGPCGLWPEDLGPSIDNKSWFDNKPYYNFGCSNQRNLAAMVDNPADLVQPRPETPAYWPRRNAAFEKYKKGTATTTTYPEADKAKLSDTGK